MRLDENLIVTHVGSDTVAVPVGAAAERLHGIVRLNETAVDILDCLKTETTEAEIVEKMLDRYEAGRDEIAAGVAETLRKLREIGALVE